jgi:phenylpropionate dioxygenase-like ring-hydroxylating dioxygenase large terminal subunit
VVSDSLELKLTAPPVKPHLSVARMTDYWYIACRAGDLQTSKPLALTILGIPLVVFRAESGEVGALLDRCPHRNVPLSIGRVQGANLQCRYHGWEFDRGGACKAVPGLADGCDLRGREAVAYPAQERQGYVWVFTNPDLAPTIEPYHIPLLDDRRYTHARRRAEAEGTLHATIENALDVPHTAYLHKGLFRGAGTRNDITAVMRRWSDRCEAQYLGEPRPEGLAARLLAPAGAEVTHFDRFFLPSVAQVDYSIGDDTHFMVTSICTPVSDFVTKLYAVVSFRLRRVPGWLVKPFLEPLGRAIFAQDARVLRLQTQNIQRFGGEQFVHTELDVLGPHIWRLMRAAERGAVQAEPGPPVEKRVEMRV